MLINRRKLNFLVAAGIVANLASGFSQEDAKITLPEMTTTVSGESIVAGRDAVPDFSEILPSFSESEILPKLPGANVSSSKEELIADFTDYESKSIYAKGLIGGGFPGFFTGDFSIYKNSGDNPFLLEFSHTTQNGYGKNSAGDGFFDSRTCLYGEKTFTPNHFKIDASAGYEIESTGMQDRSLCFFDMNYQTISGKIKMSRQFPKGFSAYGNLDGEYYNRYAGLKSGTNIIVNQEKDFAVFAIEPSVGGEWNFKDFRVALECNVFFDITTKDTESYADENFPANDSFDLSRVDAILSAGWKNDILKIGANVGVVGGTDIGDNKAVPVFEGTFEATWKPDEKSRSISLSLDGGLESRKSSVRKLEEEFKFSSLLFLPSEVSDWFVSAKAMVPAGNKITFEGTVDFKKTAFDNGAWEADYDERYPSGVYGFEQIDRNYLNTTASISFAWKIFTISAGVKSNWIHIPSNEYAHCVLASMSFDDENAAWGFSASFDQPVDMNKDMVPVLGGQVYYKLRNSVRLAFELDDAIKLVTLSDRDFMESDYAIRAGSASLLLSFFF